MGLIFSLTLISSLIIKGRVIDDVTGELIYYAQIVLDEIKRGTTSDPSGDFELKNIPPGKYTLSVHYLGYEIYRKTLELKEGRVPYIVVRLKKNTSLSSEGDRSNRYTTTF